MLQTRILRHQRQLKNFNMRLSVTCDSRILSFVKQVESFQHERLDPSQRTITFGIDTAACKTVVLADHRAARGYLVHKDSLLGCAYSTVGRDKVKCMIQERRSFAPQMRQESQWPSRAQGQLSTLLDGGHQDDSCGRWVCFGSRRQGFRHDPRTEQKIEFTPTPGG